MKDKKAITYEEAIKDMTEEELERFHKERYEKFIKPLMEMNERENQYSIPMQIGINYLFVV